MLNFLRRFIHQTDGAVTVDWVVMTAAVVGLGIMGASTVSTGALNMGDNVGAFMTSDPLFAQNK